MILCFRFAARVWIWHCSRKISIWSNGLAPMHIAHRIIHIRKNRCSLLMSMASWSSMNVPALTLSRCNQNDCGHTKKKREYIEFDFWQKLHTGAARETQVVHRTIDPSWQKPCLCCDVVYRQWTENAATQRRFIFWVCNALRLPAHYISDTHTDWMNLPV